jgi:hypothetical protein|tara:strand:- start:985 stop:1434 length:450 start_codon:yes stop_codon:yes gene_type:complete
MRISNIQNYLGGADNVIVREVAEGNQFLLSVNTNDTTDFATATFDIKAECFTATVERNRGSVKITSLAPEASATAQTYIKGNQIFNTGTAGSFDFLVPSTLLSDQNSSLTSTADDTTPFIVVCKVQWEAGSPAQKKSLRFVFIIRYQPQ